jgi:hypothetical protein
MMNRCATIVRGESVSPIHHRTSRTLAGVNPLEAAGVDGDRSDRSAMDAGAVHGFR